ncbi:MAG: cell division protein FtsB [Xanthomonadales bacterium]|nr:cell division protein FtsB [Xanthomonadales bacterium]
MKVVHILLISLLVLLQFQLWFGTGGLRETWQLEAAVAAQSEENEQLLERNKALQAQVEDLKTGLEAVEELARSELGLVSPDEEFYQVVENPAGR